LLERSWIRVVGHRDVPGKPELLGTTRDFLDYFGLKKLDDLPTLAQLKELEELRVQLSLPGAEPQAASPAAAAQAVDCGEPSAAAAQDDDELRAGVDPHADDEEEQGEEPEQHAAGHSHGLVARGVQDDTH
jgi:segregation and condensation protein B